MSLSLRGYMGKVEEAQTVQLEGKVSKVIGTVIEGTGPSLAVGGVCRILSPGSSTPVRAEVVGFREGALLLMPLSKADGVEPGSVIVADRYGASIGVGPDMLGRVLDGLGNPIDGKGPIRTQKTKSLYADPINPLDRTRIKKPLDVGVRVINNLITLGKGQRMAIMAGSGVGKSLLLGMMARFTKADVNVIALIGERGREVKEFLERDLGDEGLKRSVVVVATSDTSPLIRIRGAYLATAIAEFFREQEKDVLMMMDSVTRFAMAVREVGLASGEPPTNKAYPPSTFAHLPRLLERAGTSRGNGSITGIYTVLVEGDDMNEPIADAVRSIVDGHIVLDRKLAARGHYPAVDVLSSVSRVMSEVVDNEHLGWSYEFRSTLADYAKIEDLVNLGAYEKGHNKRADYAVEMIEDLNRYLRQNVQTRCSIEKGLQEMASLLHQEKRPKA